MFTIKRAHNDYHRHLQRVPLFGSLSGDELDAIARSTTILRLDEGQVLATEGARGAEMMILVSGTADVERGGERIATLGDGDVVGELAVLASEPRTATVVATSEVELIHLSAADVTRVLAEVPAIAPKMLAVVAARVIDHEGNR